jgi:hypothetical protein
MSIGRLRRNLDAELIAKMQSGWKPKDRAEPMKRQPAPRRGLTYRGARRNVCLRAYPRQVWSDQHYLDPTLIREVSKRMQHPPVRPNRSRKWDKAK